MMQVAYECSVRELIRFVACCYLMMSIKLEVITCHCLQNLLSDMAANGGWPVEIEKRASVIMNSKYLVKEPVEKRLKEITDHWDNLNELKHTKEQTLEGATRYNQTYLLLP